MRTATVLLLAMSAPAAWSQQVISARAGVVHYVEGKVLVNDKALEPKAGEFPPIPSAGTLKTEDGRAEVLLAPGVFLRVKENSTIRLISNKIEDTKVELLTGSILVECAEADKENALAIHFKDQVVELKKNGLYRFDTDPERFRVYDGQAIVGSITVKQDRELAYGSTTPVKFDAEMGDAFQRWAKRRAGYISMANISAAHYIANHSSTSNYRRGFWTFNDYFGMFTYIPLRGVIMSPFGYRYFSPSQVYAVYYPPRATSSGMMSAGGGGWGGYSTGPRTASVGGGGGMSAGPVAPSSGASTARTAESSSPRGGEGGGRGR